MTDREFCRRISDLCVKIASNPPLWAVGTHDSDYDPAKAREWYHRWLSHAYRWNALETP